MTVPTLSFRIFLLTLFINCAHCQNRNCPAGQFFSVDARRCEQCPPGTFRTNRFFEPKTRCNECKPGTFNPNFGLVSGDVCRLCYEDTFSSESASAQCQPCPPGQIANRGSTQCLKCGPGFEASTVDFFRPKNPSKCVPCRKGTYSDGPNNRVCKQCPEFMTGPKQATSLSDCKMCPAGKEAYQGSGGCLPCRVGDFKPGKEGRCEVCPLGSISTKEGSTSCKPCPKGTRPNGFRRSKCVPCPDGATTMTPGAPYCRRIGLPCPAGFFETKSGDCDTCPEGYRYNSEENSCEKCAVGSVSRGRLQAKCRKCPAGQQPDYFRRECICQEGEQFADDGKCEKCPKGTFINNQYIGFDGCVKCEVGFFADERGSLNCKPCPRGTAASEEGSTRCEICGPDLMPNVPRSDPEEEANACVARTTGCPLGWVRKDIGATTGPIFGCKRISCRVGTPVEDIGKTCVPCERGEALNEKGTNCRRCAKDEVSDGGIITECKKCPNGLLRDFEDGSKCTCLRYGYGIQNGVCKPCPKGSYSLEDTGVCRKCEPGRFTDRARQSSCTKCKRNTISKMSGATKCRECPEGTVSNRIRGGTECIRL